MYNPFILNFENPRPVHNIEIVVLVPVSPKTEKQLINSCIHLVQRAAAPFRLCRLVFDSAGTSPPPDKPHPYRQEALAKIRQDMVDKYLGTADWVAWIDVDIIDYPANLLSELISRSDGGIAAPILLMDGQLGSGNLNGDGFGPGRFFDVAGYVEGLRWARFEEPWFDQPGPEYSLDSVGGCYVVNAEIYRKGARHAADPYSLDFIRHGLSWSPETVQMNQQGPANCLTEHFSVCQWAKQHGLPVRAYRDLIARHAKISSATNQNDLNVNSLSENHEWDSRNRPTRAEKAQDPVIMPLPYSNGDRAISVRRGAENIVRAIVFHLPQFHPIPENDEWWGKGFTEWTNVVRAKPRFQGHWQPHLPTDLGFYDLRLPEARAAQAELAASYGIYGFCYYHYWFDGRQVLDRPVNEIWKSGEPEFPFCLCWANENWTRGWDGLKSDILLEQKYSPADDLAHIRSLVPIFSDRRYIQIMDRPLFLVYRANELPEPKKTTDIWREEAERAGLKGLYLVRVESFVDECGDPRSIGFDCSLEFQPRWSLIDNVRIFRRKWWHRRRLGTSEAGFVNNGVFDYEGYVKNALRTEAPGYPQIPCVFPHWDNSPRRSEGAAIFVNSTPEIYERWLREVVDRVRARSVHPEADPLVFINAWNEWGEGCHLEPCQKWGHQYLEATRKALGTSATQAVEYVEG